MTDFLICASSAARDHLWCYMHLYAREAGASGASAILFSSLIAKSRLSLSADSQSCSLACYFRRLISLLSTRQIIFQQANSLSVLRITLLI